MKNKKNEIIYKAKQRPVPSGDTVTVGTVVTGKTKAGKLETITAYFDERDVVQLTFSQNSDDRFKYGAIIELPEQRRMQIVYVSKDLYVYLQDKFWKKVK